MKSIFTERIKQQLTRILFLTTLFLFTSNSYAQISIDGTSAICIGETEAYTIVNADPNTTYTWSISPTGQSANVQAFNQAIIQWVSAGNYTITVTGGGVTVTKGVSVYETLIPMITFDNEVGCQETKIEQGSQTNVVIEKECISVCENSEVKYTVHGTLLGGNNFSSFSWEVTGGVIVSTNNGNLTTPTTSLAGGTIGTGDYYEVTVKWGSVGTGTLKVTEMTLYANSNGGSNYVNPTHCKPKSKELCFDIIESPTADFLIDDLTSLPTKCYDICKNAEVHFTDISTANSSSQIVFWEWDFGDGSPISHLQSPTHRYDVSGNFTAKLKVTNKCGCEDILSVDICVNPLPAPQIECPSVVCEDDKAVYTTHNACSQYMWTVNGGTITQNNGSEIIVNWNNVGQTGYGYIGLDGSYCNDVCPSITKIKVPVVLQSGTIDGPTNVCTESSYYFELPPWPATNYYWTFTNNTSGATFGSYDENSHLVEILSGGAEGSFTLACTYNNTIAAPGCGGSASINVIVRKKPIITLNHDEICVSTTTTATLSNYTTLTGTTTWFVEDPNSTITPYTTGSGVNNITFPTGTSGAFPVAGKYKIYVSNPTSFCDPDYVEVDVLEPPSIPTAIFGEDYVCPTYPYTYSVDIMENTISTWTTNNGTIQGSIYGNSISAKWTTATPKSISVNRTWENIPGCTSPDYTIPINNLVITGSISGPTSVNEDATTSYSFTPTVPGVVFEAYNWRPDLTKGGVSSGQGTDNCDITWLHQGVASTSTVLNIDVTKCGITQLFSLPITILGNTVITSITNPTGTNSFCSGENIYWTVNTIGATPTALVWDFGDGTIISQNASNQPVTSVYHIYNNTTNNTQTYTLTVQAISGANNTVSSTFSITITVYPSPNVGLSPANVENYCPTIGTYPVSITNNSSGTFTYQWYFDGVNAATPLPIGSANTPSYTIHNIPNTIPASTTADGEYWCVVTNSVSGCSSATNKKSVLEDCGGGAGGCTPVSPYGITNFAATNSCGVIQASCNTAGTLTTNINSFSWQLSGPGIYTTSGTATKDQSPTYTVNKAGIYNIQVNIQYKDASDPNGNCPLDEDAYVTVPLVTDFLTGIVCNTNQTSYDLELYNYSTVFPVTNAATYQWKINSVPVSTNFDYTALGLAPGSTQVVELIVTSGGVTCTKTATIVMPTLPVADFSATTTYTGNPLSPYKSCEGREIAFTNLSAPTTSIISNVWDFDDGTTSLLINPRKVYGISSPNVLMDVDLTIKDHYGCINTKTKQVKIYDNNLAFGNSPQYNPSSSDVCYLQNLSTPIAPNFSGGTSPFSYQWYNETVLLSGLTTSTLSGAPPGSGAYWVRVYDTHNCYKDINPTPALISIHYPPTAYINGKNDFCEGEEVMLKAVTGMPTSAGLTYQWTYTSNGNSNSSQTAKTFQMALGAGTYSFSLEVFSSGVCVSSTSNPFIVTVHPVPATPAITLGVVDCDKYELQLSGSSTISPTPTYNWSNGASGQNASIFHGGAYRLWTTDQYGCKSHADIDVPYAPDYYFWRFPTGCYTFCPNALPRRVDGPSYVVFESWEWYKDGLIINPNGGGFAGAGYNTVCDPLVLDDPSTVTGDYNWVLNTALCKQSTDYMNISIIECCELDLEVLDIKCVSGTQYSFTLLVNGVSCSPSFYNIYAELSNGTNTPLIQNIGSTTTPTPMNAGTNTLSGTFNTFNANNYTYTDVTFYVQDNCHPDYCSGSIKVEMPPPCSKRIGQFHNQSEDSTSERSTLLEIIPNPSNSVANIRWNISTDNNSTHNYRLRIIDVTGRPIKELKLESAIGKYQLNVNNLAQGVYFVEIIDSNNRSLKVKRMIVNN